MIKLKVLIFSFVFLMLSGCDLMDEVTGVNLQQAKINESKAAGAACRQSGLGLEDCFSTYEKNSKNGILLGWKEMDQYMRENNLKEQNSSIKK